MANLTTPTGWNRWALARTTVSEVQLPDASFPVLYTPASGFWVQSVISHCLVPWFQVMDPFSAFLVAGGSTGSIIGSIGGLTVWEQLYAMWVAGASFSLFGTAPGPRFGYSVGTSFKQLAYVRFDIQNVPFMVLDLGHTIELLENSRFKRIYVNHGEIERYDIIEKSDGTKEHILNIGINKTGIAEDLKAKVQGTRITITSPEGTTFIVGAKSMTDNWGVVIDDPGDKIPSSGDFYQLDTTWVIEDPYLLSGFFEGTESDYNATAQSGLNLYVSDKEKPYEEGKILGLYIWKEKELGEAVVFQPSPGVNMRDDLGYEWCFLGFDNSDVSQTYSDDIRYKENVFNEADEEGNVNRYTARTEADDADYSSLLENSTTNHLRVEISVGGYYTRNNWHAPALAGSYLSIDDKLYKILAHVEANIIDVSIKSVDGQSKLPILDSATAYSIINQSAWMINENYFQNFPSFDTVGVFEGNVIEINSNTNTDNFFEVYIGADVGTRPRVSYIVTVLVPGDPTVARSKKNGFSLVERYKTEIEIPDTMVKLYSKQQDWKLISNLTEYQIDSIVFGDSGNEDGSGPYEMTVTLRYEPTNLSVGQKVYVSFDDPFKTTSGRIASKASSLSLDVTAAAEGNMYGFITSNVLCLDGSYFSVPYAIDVPIDSRVGVCDGYLFGLDANGSAAARDGDLMFFTVPRTARGIASLFHTLRQEDWVAYQDPVTKKITMRRGSLNFKEYPMKNMVVIGERFITESVTGGSEISLNTDYEWLRRIQFAIPNAENTNSLGVLFGIGNKDNIYGFYVSGDGLVDLQLLRRQGKKRGEVSNDTYQGGGFNVSPVYVYKRDYYQNLIDATVDMGVKSIDGPIYVNFSEPDGYVGGSVSNVTTEYIYDNQTLEDLGFFDIIRLPHGEVILIYGQSTEEFKVEGNLNNSSDGSNQWSNPNSVMIAGTFNDSFVWTAPLANRTDDPTEQNQYAMMVLNSVEYLSSTYNPLNNNLYIFARCFKDQEPYLGCFIVNICQLSPFEDNIFLCSHPEYNSSQVEETPMNFLWRHPLLTDDFLKNEERSWTDSVNLMNDGYSYEHNTDNFVRIMGAVATNSQIQSINEFAVISTHLLPNGTFMVLYDTNSGVQAIFSNDSGRMWHESDLIYARGARSPTIIGHRLFYISTSGIEMKKTDFIDFYTGLNLSLKKGEGFDIESEEKGIQESLDDKEQLLIGSGPIGFQRLSGYITPDGTMKIFFYNEDSLLKCLESKDSSVWTVADNF